MFDFLSQVFIRCFGIVNENLYVVVNKPYDWLKQIIAWFVHYKVRVFVHYVETPYRLYSLSVFVEFGGIKMYDILLF